MCVAFMDRVTFHSMILEYLSASYCVYVLELLEVLASHEAMQVIQCVM